jgi:hypothetical protein
MVLMARIYLVRMASQFWIRAVHTAQLRSFQMWEWLLQRLDTVVPWSHGMQPKSLQQEVSSVFVGAQVQPQQEMKLLVLQRIPFGIL